MVKFWNTNMKRIFTMVSMAIVGWHAITMGFPDLPQWPDFINTEYYGGISILVVAGVFTLYSVWMMNNNELNG